MTQSAQAAMRQPWRRGLVLAAVMSALALGLPRIAPRARAAEGPDKVLRAQAEELEVLGDWSAAAAKYQELFRLDRSQAAFQQRYTYCLRRYFQTVRFRDASYRKDVLTLKYPQAVRLYEVVLHNLLNNALDRGKVSLGALLRSGIEEYRFALSNSEFCSDQLGGLKPDQTRPLRSMLQAHFGSPGAMTFGEAVETMREVVMRSKQHFPNINPTTVVMEFVCGACQAMDDYTVYLTPRQLRELCATLKGQYVGVGVRLKLQGNRILIAEVQPDSPAAETFPPLGRDDHIVAIDKKSTLTMSFETATELLEGDEGTLIELEVLSPTNGLRIVMLRRRPLVVPSVQHGLIDELGYLKIQCFQEPTLQEFDTQVADLLRSQCKVLLLDLRGNPGGLLDVSIDIARRFLLSGIIVSAQHRDSRSSKTYRSANPTALTIPVVVLVDGDTASAAEVLAGALKENHRARIVGQTTYGKGCSQGVLKLPGEGELRSSATPSVAGSTGGIRITVARFISPTGQPYSGRGVEPDVFAEGDWQLYQAREEAYRLLSMQ